MTQEQRKEELLAAKGSAQSPDIFRAILNLLTEYGVDEESSRLIGDSIITIAKNEKKKVLQTVIDGFEKIVSYEERNA